MSALIDCMKVLTSLCWDTDNIDKSACIPRAYSYLGFELGLIKNLPLVTHPADDNHFHLRQLFTSLQSFVGNILLSRPWSEISQRPPLPHHFPPSPQSPSWERIMGHLLTVPSAPN